MGMEKMKPVDKRLEKNSERKSPLSSLMSIIQNRPSDEKEFSATTISGILHVAMSNMGLYSANALALRLDIIIEVVKAGAPGIERSGK
jgi:hypothetical protein